MLDPPPLPDHGLKKQSVGIIPKEARKQKWVELHMSKDVKPREHLIVPDTEHGEA